MPDSGMTSLLAQVRTDPDVVKAAEELEQAVLALDVIGGPEMWENYVTARDAYDTALLRAAVRVLAARAREQVRRHAGANSPTEYWEHTVWFIQSLASEET